MTSIKDKRKFIKQGLRTKFKYDIDVYWWDGFHGNQIVELTVFPYALRVKVEIDSIMFNENNVDANIDFIMYYVKRSILDIFINAEY